MTTFVQDLRVDMGEVGTVYKTIRKKYPTRPQVSDNATAFKNYVTYTVMGMLRDGFMNGKISYSPNVIRLIELYGPTEIIND